MYVRLVTTTWSDDAVTRSAAAPVYEKTFQRTSAFRADCWGPNENVRLSGVVLTLSRFSRSTVYVNPALPALCTSRSVRQSAPFAPGACALAGTYKTVAPDASPARGSVALSSRPDSSAIPDPARMSETRIGSACPRDLAAAERLDAMIVLPSCAGAASREERRLIRVAPAGGSGWMDEIFL